MLQSHRGLGCAAGPLVANDERRAHACDRALLVRCDQVHRQRVVRLHTQWLVLPPLHSARDQHADGRRYRVIGDHLRHCHGDLSERTDRVQVDRLSRDSQLAQGPRRDKKIQQRIHIRRELGEADRIGRRNGGWGEIAEQHVELGKPARIAGLNADANKGVVANCLIWLGRGDQHLRATQSPTETATDDDSCHVGGPVTLCVNGHSANVDGGRCAEGAEKRGFDGGRGHSPSEVSRIVGYQPTQHEGVAIRSDHRLKLIRATELRDDVGHAYEVLGIHRGPERITGLIGAGDRDCRRNAVIERPIEDLIVVVASCERQRCHGRNTRKQSPPSLRSWHRKRPPFHATHYGCWGHSLAPGGWRASFVRGFSLRAPGRD